MSFIAAPVFPASVCQAAAGYNTCESSSCSCHGGGVRVVLQGPTTPVRSHPPTSFTGSLQRQRNINGLVMRSGRIFYRELRGGRPFAPACTPLPPAAVESLERRQLLSASDLD